MPYTRSGVYFTLEGIGFIFLGVVFMLVGLYFVLHRASAKKRCTEVVQAKVTNIKTIQKPSKYGVSQKYYLPEYEYEYNGVVYKMDSSVKTSFTDKKVGDVKEIKVNPDNPNEIIDEGGLNTVLVSIFVTVGILFLIFGLVVM